jgi:hypothetical protein
MYKYGQAKPERCSWTRGSRSTQLSLRKRENTGPAVVTATVKRAPKPNFCARHALETDRVCGGAQPQRLRVCVDVRLPRWDATVTITRCGWAPPQTRSVQKCSHRKVNTCPPSNPYQTRLLVCIRVHWWFLHCMVTAKGTTLKSQTAPARSWGKAAALALLLLAMLTASDTHDSRVSAPPRKGSAGQAPPLRAGLRPGDHLTANLQNASLPQVIAMYGELTGRTLGTAGWRETLNDLSGGHLAKWRVLSLPRNSSLLTFHADGRWRADELKETLESILRTNDLFVIAEGGKHFTIKRINLREE